MDPACGGSHQNFGLGFDFAKMNLKEARDGDTPDTEPLQDGIRESKGRRFEVVRLDEKTGRCVNPCHPRNAVQAAGQCKL